MKTITALFIALTLSACGGHEQQPCGNRVNDPCLQPGIGDCCANSGLTCHIDPPGGPGPGPGSIDYTCQK